MYKISEAFKAAMKKPVQRFRLRGTVQVGARKIGFTESNILKGSFTISGQCSGSDEVEIGTVYTSELDCTFVGLNLPRYSLNGATIVPSLELSTAEGWEAVPLGVFYLNEANWATWGVEVTAYDAMSKLDKQLLLSSSQGTIYDFLNLAANACGVELAQTKTEIQEFPNGSDQLAIYEDNDIETWRDLVAWAAQTAGAFATINREGKLELRKYGTDPVDTIDNYHRYTGAKFSDFTTRYTGVSMVNIPDKTTAYYGLDVDDGLTYNLGSNPLIQYGLKEMLGKQRRAILDALSVINYGPMEVSMIGTPAYDLGDVLVFSDGIADASVLHCITKFDWTYGGRYQVTGVGKNPALANAKSKVDKNIAGLISESSGEVIRYYDYRNAEPIHIGDGDTGRIIEFHYVTTRDTHIDLHAEVKYKLSTTEAYDADQDIYTEHDGILKVSYVLNGELITDCYPVETRLDGTHLLHLVYTWRSTANVIGSFLVNLSLEGGEVDIGLGESRAYIAGQGLVGDDSWDGSVHLKDNVAPIDLYDLTIGSIKDSVSVVFSEAKDYTANDKIGGVDLYDYMVSAFTDKIGAISKLHRFDVPYSSAVMAYDSVAVSDGVWKLTSGSDTGSLTTPNVSVGKILRITSRHSGDDVAYIASFDGGTTWWTYADTWAEPDYTRDVYGMFEGTMRSITAAAWAEKYTGSVMVRAILTGAATVTDIQIYEEDISE